MQADPTPIQTEIVLVGGGHAHVAVLKMFGMKPEPGVRLTVIARDTFTPYSGMIPGYIAGHYAHEECHIDLGPLCRFAGARLIHAEASGIDPEAKRVFMPDRPPLRTILSRSTLAPAPTWPTFRARGSTACLSSPSTGSWPVWAKRRLNYRKERRW